MLYKEIIIEIMYQIEDISRVNFAALRLNHQAQLVWNVPGAKIIQIIRRILYGNN